MRNTNATTRPRGAYNPMDIPPMAPNDLMAPKTPPTSRGAALFRQRMALMRGSSKVKGYAKGTSGIYIKPSHKGLFTAKANKAGKSVQGYASQVLSAPKGKYPASTRRQANFARNAKKFNR